MPRALAACHSYTLIKPGSGEKITVKRGQSIDHLDEADQKYLSRQTITPPSVDDSHLAPMRTPIFQEVVEEDVRGHAQTEPFNMNVGGAPSAGAQTVEPVRVQVVVSPEAGVSATASVDGDEDDADAGDDGDAAGADDSGGAEGAEAAPEAAAATPKAEAAPKAKRQSKARQKA